MKLGTDTVLLGAFADAAGAGQVLDIGTGTGVLALMMAQKSNARIDAIEIDESACEEAQENFEHSIYRDRIRLHCMPLQKFIAVKKYDLIISNPPYFKAGKSFRIEDEQRAKARHDRDLPFEELCASAAALLAPSGKFWLILPVQESLEFISVAKKSALHLNTQIKVHSVEGKAVKRMIMAFAFGESGIRISDFSVYQSDGKPTQGYIDMTRDFYLWKDLDDVPGLKW